MEIRLPPPPPYFKGIIETKQKGKKKCLERQLKISRGWPKRPGERRHENR